MSDDNNPLTAAEIEELRELDAKATKGPWVHESAPQKEGRFFIAYCGHDEWVYPFDQGLCSDTTPTVHDAALIAAMRNALPRLLSMLQPPADAAESCDRCVHENALCGPPPCKYTPKLPDAAKCDVCGGSGELQDAQAWDCGQDNSPCPYCYPADAAVREAMDVCPFCGSLKTRTVGVEIKYERDRYHRVKCDGCGAYGPAVSAHQINYSPDEDEKRRAEAKRLWGLRYVRAVQSPRLTSEQVEAVRNAVRFAESYSTHSVARRLRAAFPGVFGQEG